MSKKASGANVVKVNRPKTNKKLTLFIVPFIVKLTLARRKHHIILRQTHLHPSLDTVESYLLT